jgi:nucleoside-diphosphate-sugar epimerase
MKLLLTGANGFTGIHFSKISTEKIGYEVFPLQANLTDSDAVKREVLKIKPDIVLHLAAISFVAHGDAETIYRVNITGTRNLLQALSTLDKPPKAVLLASSANVYGNAKMEVIDESVPLLPANDYGVSKMAMEHVARLWMDRLPIIISRPFNYTGPGQNPKFLIAKIVGHFIRKEALIELGNLDVEREFSDVRAVCNIYRKLIDTPEAIGKTFNICSGNAYSLRHIISTMEKIAGYKIDVQINPEFVRPNEIKRLIGSNQYLHEIIGAQKYPRIEETLRWMYEDGLKSYSNVEE